eukprot:gene32707-17129_t
MRSTRFCFLGSERGMELRNPGAGFPVLQRGNALSKATNRWDQSSVGMRFTTPLRKSWCLRPEADPRNASGGL